MRRIFLYSAIGVGVVVVVTVFLFFSVFAVATQDYALSVDPIKDNQYLFSTARVMITNTGKLPLTSIVVNYGGKSVDRLAVLSQSTGWLSPLQSVAVTADHGLSVTKSYRTPWKIPGMMGS